MLQNTIQRLYSQRSVCKQSAVFLSIVILLVGAVIGLSRSSLMWAGAPLLLLWLAEAGYAAEQKRCEEWLKGAKGKDDESAFVPEASVGGVVSAACSMGVLPFYLVLLGIVAAAAFYMPVKVPAPQTVTIASQPAGFPMQPYRPATTGPMAPPQRFAAPPNASPFPYPARTLMPSGASQNSKPLPLPNPGVVRGPTPNAAATPAPAVASPTPPPKS